MVRVAKESCHLGQVYIPKGALICADMSDLHRNPLVWNDPYRFDPERFLPGGEAERQPAGSGWAWAPFSNGGRICVGMNFSLAEQRVVLSMLRKFTREQHRVKSDPGLIARVLLYSSQVYMDIAQELYPSGWIGHAWPGFWHYFHFKSKGRFQT